jgi:integrase
MNRPLRHSRDIHRRLLLTDDAVKALPLAKGGRGYVAHDTKLDGLRCVVGQKTKLLVLQTERRELGGRRRSIYKRLGDPQFISLDTARAHALEELARQARVTKPEAKAGSTFGEAWEGYKAQLKKKKRSTRTIADYQQKFDNHLAGVFGKVALADIARADVTKLHDRLTEDVGPYAANGVCRLGHAVYRYAVLEMEVPDLKPLNPFRSYNLHNPEQARQTGMAEKDLPGWFRKILALDNPVLREFYLFALLAGLRRRNLTALSWGSIKKQCIEILYSKNNRPSRVPITPPMARSLDRLRRLGKILPERCHRWVFPSPISKSGHLEEPKNKALNRSPHALRHTFRGMCAGAKVSTVHSKLLMLHAVDQEVHDEYMTTDAMFDQLAKASAEVSAYILRHLPRDAEKQLKARMRDKLGPAWATAMSPRRDLRQSHRIDI